MSKQLIWAEVDIFDPEFTIASLIEQLQHYAEVYNATVRIEQRARQYDDGYYYAVVEQVEETDEQYAMRLIEDQQYADEANKRERAELQRLLNKFGAGRQS